jgi:microcystin-dependent protein
MRRGFLLLLLLVVFASAFVSAAFAQERYIGSISLVPYNFAPVDTFPCDGRLLPISGYETLFNLIGTTYGGDGEETFALPDLRGRVVIGQGQGPGTSNYTIGQTGGEETVTLTLSQIPAHTHTAMASKSNGDTASPAGAYWAPRARTLLFSNSGSLTPIAPQALATTGGNQPHDNLKPYLAMTYVIWAFGIYPSQE